MAARKSIPPRGSSETKSGPVDRKTDNPDGTRETVEHIVIAFVLAFVFKTFQAEAYVIPTGSMAPTLYGRHKEVVCPQCNFHYTIGASQEVDQESGLLLHRISSAICTNCRYHLDKNVKTAPVFNGDRILVNKQVRDYRRFHVIVFKNPEEPHINYIKRLIGLPNETLRIRRGDIYTREKGAETWQIQRKQELDRQKDIQLTVYDDRFPAEALVKAGGGERWAPCEYAAVTDTPSVPDRELPSPAEWQVTENAWQPDSESRSYRVTVDDDEAHWLRYRNLVPSPDEWAIVDRGQQLARPVQPSLILDFCGFNEAWEDYSDSRYISPRSPVDRGLYWVPDLTLSASVTVESVTAESRLTFELTESDRIYQCEFIPMTGAVEIYLKLHSDPTRTLLTQTQTELQGAGTWSVSFANVDQRLCLWIDGAPVELGQTCTFDNLMRHGPTNADLTPAGIAATRIQATVSELLLQRDLYYRNDTIYYRPSSDAAGQLTAAKGFGHPRDFQEVPEGRHRDLKERARFPEIYSDLYSQLVAAQNEKYGNFSDYELASDEYLMCGDNSPASKDSRLFDYESRMKRGLTSHRHAVRKEDLIGEALWIFWPHAVPFMNGGQGYSIRNHRRRVENEQRQTVIAADASYPLYRFPFYPGFSRMKKIR
jgi:signal peptidase I